LEVTLGKNPLAYCGTMRADLDGSGTVTNLNDLLIFAKAYGSTPAQPNWNPRADQNGDNAVGFADLLLFATQWGKNVSQCP
jgi:hypothetical protein